MNQRSVNKFRNEVQLLCIQFSLEPEGQGIYVKENKVRIRRSNIHMD